jgi:hypothetical protein
VFFINIECFSLTTLAVAQAGDGVGLFGFDDAKVQQE